MTFLEMEIILKVIDTSMFSEKYCANNKTLLFKAVTFVGICVVTIDSVAAT